MAGRIKEEDIALVRERARIDDVVGSYVTLKNAGGGNLKGLCPFHDEKSPSFNVTPARGFFYCFGCQEGGDVIDFIQKVDQITFSEAVETLAAKVGIQLRYEDSGAPVQRGPGNQRPRLVEAHKVAAEFYVDNLFTAAEASLGRQFLDQRGFDKDAAVHFGVGFSPRGGEALVSHLRGRGFTNAELVASGLSADGQRGLYDRFRGRLMWPIRDASSEVIGFGARRLFDDDRIEAKYLNTPETPIYKKSKVLYGVDLARREIAKGRQAVVVEGYTDVMACHLSGVQTAVATCGTSFGDDHARVLRQLLLDHDQFRGEVIFTFDGDEAGQKAALKAFEGEQTFAAQTYIAVAPDGMDPCELRLAKGDAAVRDLVARRIPLFEFAIRSILKEYDLDSVDGQVAALQRTVPLVAQIKDRARRDGYATRLAWWAGWQDADMVVRRVRESTGNGAPVKAGRRAPQQNGDADIARPQPKDPRYLAQREVLKAALQEPAIAGPEYDALPEDAFTHPAYVAVHQAVLKAGGAGSGLAGPALIDAASTHTPQGTVRTLLSELAVEPLRAKGEADARYIGSMIAAVQENLVGRQVAEIKSRLQRLSPIEAEEEYRALFGDLVALEEYRKALREQAIGGMD